MLQKKNLDLTSSPPLQLFNSKEISRVCSILVFIGHFEKSQDILLLLAI